MSQTVFVEKKGSITVVTIDNPPVNALSQSVRAGLVEAFSTAAQDSSTEAILLTCNGRTFIAGADIREFGQAPLQPYLPDVLETIDQCPIPTFAVLHGTALGGGLETALACRYRIAHHSARVGLPEVHLGLIPGAGGTQRLPRIAGLAHALEMITSGRHVAADEAAEMGLVDHLTGSSELTDAALNYARSIIAGGAVKPRVSELCVENTRENQQLLESWNDRTRKTARGQQSPLVAIEAISSVLNMPFADGLKRERELFQQCLTSEQSSALRYIFFAERAATKFSADVDAKPRPVQTTAVIGGGTMGRGIAMCLANAGIPATIVETSREQLQQSLQAITNAYDQMLTKQRIDEKQMADRLALINGSCDYAQLADHDLIIEAAFEDMDVKREIFSLLDRHCRSDAILATNTSYLDIESIAAVVSDPSRVIGMHFFSPANIMKLLEVIRTPLTSAASISTVMKLGKQLGKTCVLVGNGFGFAANRMYSAYQRQGQQLMLEGVSPVRLDNAMKQWGMAMGPAAVMDMSGLDIGYMARRQHPNPPSDPCYFRPADLLVENGFLGRKSGRGFYRYDADTGEAQEDPEVVGLILREAGQLGVRTHEYTDHDIQQRMINAIADEGQKILDEGIAAQPADLDVIWVNGFGFPRWRGGPMFMAGKS